MTCDIEPISDTGRDVAIERRNEAMDAARRYANKSRSVNTWRSYEASWRVFERWAESVALPSLPATPDTVAMFIGAQGDAGLSVATLEHRLAAIRLMHLGQGAASPHNTLAVQEVMRGVRRERAKQRLGPSQKAPLLDSTIKRLVDTLDLETPQGLRDRALLLYGFAGALRRSELVAINKEHIERREKGHILTIPVSKGDQERIGQAVAILAQPDSPYCPVRAMDEWIANSSRANPTPSVFVRIYRGNSISQKRLSDRAVAEKIKSLVYQLHDENLDYKNFSGHSLRRGFLSSAGDNQADILQLIAQSRHKRVDTVLQYLSKEDPFKNHAGERLLLSDQRVNMQTYDS